MENVRIAAHHVMSVAILGMALGSCLSVSAHEAVPRPPMQRYAFPVDAKRPAAERPVTHPDTPLENPKPRVRINPPMPMSARHRWEEGCVLLEFVIRTDGKTERFRVVESNPPGVFEKSVISAVAKWQYDPRNAELTVIEAFPFVNPIRRSSPSASTNGTALGLGRYQGQTCSIFGAN